MWGKDGASSKDFTDDMVQHDWWIESPGVSWLWPLYQELLVSQSCSTLIFLDWYSTSPCSLVYGMITIICMHGDQSHSSAGILLSPLEVGLFSLLAHRWLSLFEADFIYCAIWIHVKICSLYWAPQRLEKLVGDSALALPTAEIQFLDGFTV